MSEIDYRRVIEDNFSIVNENGQVVPFILTNIQKRFLKEMTGRDIVLKARQVRMTSLCLAIITVDFLMLEHSRSMIVAHETSMTQMLLDKAKFFIRSTSQKMGVALPLDYNSRRELVNRENGATLFIAAAGSREIGRSQSLTNILLSEFAFYEKNADPVYTAASQAGNPKRIMIESTANGIGNKFHTLTQESQSGKKKFHFHFYGWNDHEEYTLPHSLDKGDKLTKEERSIKKLYALTNGQIAWRREKLKEIDEEKFKQEYPINPTEAFVSSGRPVFNVPSLMKYLSEKDMVRDPEFRGYLEGAMYPIFQDDDEGPLKVWKPPEANASYAIGADCSSGSSKDFSCGQVIEKTRWEVVATLHGQFEPDVFAKELFKLGMFYNEAVLAPERNSLGIGVVLTLRDLFYPNIWVNESVKFFADQPTHELGFSTTKQNKGGLIADMGHALRTGIILIHDRETINELLSYHYTIEGSAGAVSGAFDDRVMALMIALHVIKRIQDTREKGAIYMGRNSGSTSLTAELSDDAYF